MASSPAWEFEGKGWEGSSRHSKTAVAATSSLNSSGNVCAAIVLCSTVVPNWEAAHGRLLCVCRLSVYRPSHKAVHPRAGLGLDA